MCRTKDRLVVDKTPFHSSRWFHDACVGGCHEPSRSPSRACGLRTAVWLRAQRSDGRHTPSGSRPGTQQQQRMQRVEELRAQRRDDVRQRHVQHEQGRGGSGGEYDHATPRGASGGKNFVDVDDMTEEVVEMTFEEDAVPLPVAKKK